VQRGVNVRLPWTPTGSLSAGRSCGYNAEGNTTAGAGKAPARFLGLLVTVMWFSKQLPLSGLIELCRTLRHNLGAGLTLVRVFRQLAQRGLPSVRPVAGRISTELEKGESLEAALEREKESFPPLFIDMAVVAEQTGNLAEIFGELEQYYRMQQTLRRQFRSKIAPTVVQFVLAVFVIATMLFVLGIIAESHGTRPGDPTGLGLRGKAGAFVFLAAVFVPLGLLIAAYLVLTRTLRRKAAVDEILLRLPVVGPCLRAFALGRFTLALRLALETGMPIGEALRLSLRATGNAAYMARTEMMVKSLEDGDDLAQALARSRIFPEEFQNIIAVAEEGGRIAEVLEQQAKFYQEEAGRRLAALTRAAGFGLWVLYAVFMVIAIMRIAGSYISALGGR
jgi:type IV pilus assembly protein PilC